MTAAIFVLIASLFIFGVAGQEPLFSVETQDTYPRYEYGYIFVTIENRWWTRDIKIENVIFEIDYPTYYGETISRLPEQINRGESETILIEFNPQSWQAGTFDYTITVICSQTLIFVFGEQTFEIELEGSLVIS